MAKECKNWTVFDNSWKSKKLIMSMLITLSKQLLNLKGNKRLRRRKRRKKLLLMMISNLRREEKFYQVGEL